MLNTHSEALEENYINPESKPFNTTMTHSVQDNAGVNLEEIFECP